MKNERFDLLVDFVLEIIELVKYLKVNKELVMCSQLLRSGRLVDENITETQTF